MEAASVVRAIIDTPILAGYRAGEPDAVAFMAAVRALGQPEFSQLSAMVLIANCADAAELTNLGWFFYPAVIHGVTARIARRAQDILESVALPTLLTADDAIIAATAIEHKLPLYTLDPARFAGVAGLAAIQPY